MRHKQNGKIIAQEKLCLYKQPFNKEGQKTKQETYMIHRNQETNSRSLKIKNWISKPIQIGYSQKRHREREEKVPHFSFQNEKKAKLRFMMTTYNY